MHKTASKKIILCTFVALLFFLQTGLTAGINNEFRKITRKDGLSHSSVYSLSKGNWGFMWFGTENGLNRYDGYKIKAYTHDTENNNSIASNNAGNIFIDKYGIIWIGTWGKGLSQFDPSSNKFTHYSHNHLDSNSLPDNRVQSVYRDSLDYVWVGTLKGGLWRLDLASNTTKRYQHDPQDPRSISNNRIWAIAEDARGLIWVGTDFGLNIFDRSIRSFIRFFHDPNNPKSLSHSRIRTIHIGQSGTIWVGTQKGLNQFNPLTNEARRIYLNPNDLENKSGSNKINALYEDENGILWIGSASNGLYTLDLKTNNLTQFDHNPLDSRSISHNDIRCIYGDKTGLLWIGTRGGGVNILDRKPKAFKHYLQDPDQPISLNNNQVRSLAVDSKNRLWVGTNNGGLNRINLIQKKNKYYTYESDIVGGIGNNKIRGVLVDQFNRIWIGNPDGLRFLDPDSDVFTEFHHIPGDPTSLSDDDILSIIESADGLFWVGTYKKGLNLFNPQTKKAIRFQNNPNDPSSLTDNNFVIPFEDSSQQLWVGTQYGLNKYRPHTKNFYRFFNSPNNPNSISSNIIHVIHEDAKGYIWIGTNNGLNRFDKSTSFFTRYYVKDGLPSNYICGILEDENGNLWISTGNGLSRLNLKTLKFRNYYQSDGLQSNEFSVGAYSKSPEGALLFGGLNGITSFFPDQIKDKPYPPLIVITNVLKMNKIEQYETPVYMISNFNFSYKDKMIAFEFAALDYNAPHLNQYAYKLMGFDDTWINTDADNRKAVYTNLPGGNYMLRVKASNSDKIWNQNGIAINISIETPPWKKWWAYIAYISILISIVILFLYQQKGQYKRDLHVKQLEWAKKNAEEIAQAKSDFLAHMSHEIRTPMNAILSLVRLIFRTSLSDKQSNLLQKIDQSANHLNRVVNDILDFSKIESGKLKLEWIEFSLLDLIDTISDILSIKASEKNIEFLISISNDVPNILIGDPTRLSQVLINLGGNALKFTEKGEVGIWISVVNQSEDFLNLKFEIKDTGIGMTPEGIDSLFSSYGQADSSIFRKFGGTGLGLLISKELVQLMNGKIQIESQLGQGSIFHFNAQFKVPIKQKSEKLSAPLATKKLKIAIATQNINAKIILKNLLSSYDWRVSISESIMDLINKIREFYSINQSFDVVFIDWKLIAKDDLKTLQKNKTDAHLKNTVFIIMGNDYKDRFDFEKKQAIFDNFITKPILKHRLNDTLLSVLNKENDDSSSVKRMNQSVNDIKASNSELAVLLVDDNHINRIVISELLLELNIAVQMASDCHIALDKVKQENYDLIFMDINMPHLNGFQCTQHIREWESIEDITKIPIIGLTASLGDEDREKGLSSGMNALYEKPLDLKILKSIFNSYLNKILNPVTNSQSESKTSQADLPDTIDGVDIKKALERIQGNSHLYLKLIKKFIEKNLHINDQINDSFNSARFEQLLQIVHSLKGEARYLCATALAQHAHTFELAIKTKSPHLVIAKSKFEIELNRAIITFEQLLK